MEKRISNKITYLYFIMSVMILGIHSIDLGIFNQSDLLTLFNKIIRIVYNMAVPTFFFISALLFYRNADKRKYTTVIAGKIKTLVMPYLSWNLIFGVLKLAKMIVRTGIPAINAINIYKAVLYVLLSKANPVLWFVRVLFIYFLIYPVVLFTVKKKWPCLTVILAAFVYNIYLGGTAGYSGCIYWLPVYLAGAYIGYWHNDIAFKKNGCALHYIIAVIVLVICVAAGVYNNIGLFICRMVTPFCYWLLADIMVVEKEPYWFMKQSFYYYCSQLLLTEIVKKIYVMIAGNSIISAVAAHFIVPCLLCFMLTVSAYIIYRFMNPLWCILTGNRK